MLNTKSRLDSIESNLEKNDKTMLNTKLKLDSIESNLEKNDNIMLNTKSRLDNIEIKRTIYVGQRDFDNGPLIIEENNLEVVLYENILFGKGWVDHNEPDDRSKWYLFLPRIENSNLIPPPPKDNTSDTYKRIPDTGWNSMIYILADYVIINLNGYTMTIANEDEGAPLYALTTLNGITCSNAVLPDLVAPKGFLYEDSDIITIDAVKNATLLKDVNGNKMKPKSGSNIIINNGFIYSSHQSINLNDSNFVRVENVTCSGWTHGIIGNSCSNIDINNIIITGINGIHYINLLQTRFYLNLLKAIIFYNNNAISNEKNIKSKLLTDIEFDKNLVLEEFKLLIIKLVNVLPNNDFFENNFRHYSWLTNIRNNVFHGIKIGNFSPNGHVAIVGNDSIYDYLENNLNTVSRNISIRNVTVENLILGYNDPIQNQIQILNYPNIEAFQKGLASTIDTGSLNTNLTLSNLFDINNIEKYTQDDKIQAFYKLRGFLSIYDEENSDLIKNSGANDMTSGILDTTELVKDLSNHTKIFKNIKPNNLNTAGISTAIKLILTTINNENTTKTLFNLLIQAHLFYQDVNKTIFGGAFNLLSFSHTSGADNSVTLNPNVIIDLRHTINVSSNDIIIKNITMINLAEFSNKKLWDGLIETDEVIAELSHENKVEESKIEFDKLIKSIENEENELTKLVKSDYETILDLEKLRDFSSLSSNKNAYKIIKKVQDGHSFKGEDNSLSTIAINNVGLTGENGGPYQVSNEKRKFNGLIIFNFLVCANVSFNNTIISNISNYLQNSTISLISGFEDKNINIKLNNLLSIADLENDLIIHKSKWLKNKNQAVIWKLNHYKPYFQQFADIFDRSGKKKNLNGFYYKNQLVPTKDFKFKTIPVTKDQTPTEITIELTNLNNNKVEKRYEKITDENKSDIYFKYNNSKYLPKNGNLLRLNDTGYITSDFINGRVTINTYDKFSFFNSTLELNSKL